MRKVIVCFLVLVLVGAVYAQKKKWYEEKLVVANYDRFKDSTTLGIDSQGIDAELLNNEKELMKDIANIYSKLLATELSSNEKTSLINNLKELEDKLEALKRKIWKETPAYTNLKYYENASFMFLWIVGQRKWGQEMEKRPCLFPFITFDGKVPSEPSPLLNMAFFSKSRDRKFIRGYNVRLRALVDGKPMAMPETNRTEDVRRSGTVIEIIFFELPWEDFCKLCDAQMVEFQLGFEEFEAGEPEVAVWRQFRQAYLDLLEKK